MSVSVEVHVTVSLHLVSFIPRRFNFFLPERFASVSVSSAFQLQKPRVEVPNIDFVRSSSPLLTSRSFN